MRKSEIMRRILVAVGQEPNTAGKVWAVLEEANLVRRERNTRGLKSATYGRTFAHNEIRKHSHMIRSISSPSPR